ncbi:MAG: hypothetical protein QME96_06675 [Myxococcota bacterium]|nr:hypothetical protein [Myxococcota bacterium]
MERRRRVAFIGAAAIALAVAAGCDDDGRAATCTDRLHNGRETGMDCGGPCRPCGNGWGCMTNADCASGRCSSEGVCVECTDAAQCPAGSDCVARTCDDGECGFANLPAGTPAPPDTDRDCLERRCDGAGGAANVADDDDLPVDGNDCTADVCTAGIPSNPSLPAGTPCGSGLVCNGLGACVGCVSPADCPGEDTECRTRTCDGGVCGLAFAPPDTPVSVQTPRDCREAACDGAGNVTSAVDDTDLPVDGLQCTRDVCTAGAPSNPPAADGTACTDGGGQFCRGGACLPATVIVIRVGVGSAALGSAATPVFLEQRNLSGVLLRTVPLPTAVSGTNQPLTLSGSATSEGNLTLAATGAFLALAGYAAEPGVAGIAATTASAVNRVVARVNVDFGVDTSTRFATAFSGGNVRGAATSDGSAFWATGSASGTWYIPFGTTGGARILATPGNARFVHVYAGQLYGSSGSGTFTNVFTIGAGLPTTAGQTATSLPGMPTSSASPYAFALLDRNPVVPGVDTLYVADDRSAASGGGVQKWTFDGTTWTLAATFTGGLTVGFRGLAALVTGADVTLVATSTATPSALLLMVDDGSPTPAATTLAAAAANTAYRGVSFFAR